MAIMTKVEQSLRELVVTEENRLTSKFTLEILADTVEFYDPMFCEFILIKKWIRYVKWN